MSDPLSSQKHQTHATDEDVETNISLECYNRLGLGQEAAEAVSPTDNSSPTMLDELFVRQVRSQTHGDGLEDFIPTTYHDNSSESQRDSECNSQRSTDTSSEGEAVDPYYDAYVDTLDVAGVYMERHRSRESSNFEELRRMLKEKRTFNSPNSKTSKRMKHSFKVFEAKLKDSGSKMDDISIVAGKMEGDDDTTKYGNKQRDAQATNLLPFANVTQIKPDLVYGEFGADVHQSIRIKYGKLIEMDKSGQLPLAPNLFLEYKGFDGSAYVAAKQSAHNGAVGARAMDALERYENESFKPHEVAQALSASFIHGVLVIYAHHIGPPTKSAGTENSGIKHGYYMTRLGGTIMNDSVESYERGLQMFRNACDWCQEMRGALRDRANERAKKINDLS